jgi:hypothetical protein
MAGSKTADGEHSASPKLQDARFFVMNGIVKSADLRFKRLPLIPLSSDATTSPLNVHATRDQTLTARQTFFQMLPQHHHAFEKECLLSTRIPVAISSHSVLPL